MNDTDKPNEQPAPRQDWAAEAKGHWSRKQAAFLENRTAVFDVLERGGIEAVTVIFDGYGDSGQIEDVEHTGGTEDDLAAIEVAQNRAVRGRDEVETATVPLRTAIEDMAYALLERTHCGWCNNEGGSGEFVFDVPARTITLDFNERYVDHVNHFHESRGGRHGTSIPPRPLLREEMGRRARGLSADP